MVVADSVVVRKIVTDVLSADPDIEVVGTAVNGRIAVAKLEQLKPDLVTMDIEMPEMNGIEAVRAIRATRSRVPIIMFSTLTERGASATMDALSAGASDYVTKPANVGSVGQSMESVREQLIPKIKALTGRPVSMGPARTAAAPPPPPPARPRTGPGKKPAVLVIGSSTGGPEALARVLPQLPASLPVPVLLVQHMPPVFTRQFAERLDRLSPLRVVEASDGVPLAPGTVHLAPGDHHLVVRANGRSPRTTHLTARSAGVPTGPVPAVPAHAAGLHAPVRQAAGPAQPAARGRGLRRRPARARHRAPRPRRPPPRRPRQRTLPADHRPDPGPAGELLPAGGRPPLPLGGDRLRRRGAGCGPHRHGLRRAQRRRGG